MLRTSSLNELEQNILLDKPTSETKLKIKKLKLNSKKFQNKQLKLKSSTYTPKY